MNITAVIETTENCNLRCKFCLRPSFAGSVMSLEILEKTISHIIEVSDSKVDFIWHGGEPLLAGLNFFKAIPKIQKKYNTNGLKIVNSIQTNGTLLADKFTKFFEKEGFIIGTSIQGTPKIHDSVRIDKNGNPTYDKVISRISKLKNKPSTIIVLTKDILGKEEEIYNSIKPYVRGARLSEYFPSQNNGETNWKDKGTMPDSLMPKPKEFGESMIHFYEVWKKDPNPIELRPITEFIRSFIIGKSSGCLYSQEACRHSVIGVKASGDFYTCMRGAPNKQFLLGNVCNKPLKNYKILSSKIMDKRIIALTKGPCKDCEFWNQCNGGCPLESFKVYGDMEHKALYCGGRKMILNCILKDLKDMKLK